MNNVALSFKLKIFDTSTVKELFLNNIYTYIFYRLHSPSNRLEKTVEFVSHVLGSNLFVRLGYSILLYISFKFITFIIKLLKYTLIVYYVKYQHLIIFFENTQSI